MENCTDIYNHNGYCCTTGVINTRASVNGVYYLKLCNVSDYFANYQQRLVFEVSFMRGGANNNALRFEVIKEGGTGAGNRYIINQIGGNAFYSLMCISECSVIIGVDGYLYIKAKVSGNQFACVVNIFYCNIKDVRDFIDISGLSNSNLYSAPQTTVVKELVLLDNCIINSDDQAIKAKDITANLITSGGIEANSFINVVNNSNNDILLGDGSVADKRSFLQKSGDVMTGSLTATAFIKSGASGNDILLGDGMTLPTSSLNLNAYIEITTVSSTLDWTINNSVANYNILLCNVNSGIGSTFTLNLTNLSLLALHKPITLFIKNNGTMSVKMTILEKYNGNNTRYVANLIALNSFQMIRLGIFKTDIYNTIVTNYYIL